MSIHRRSLLLGSAALAFSGSDTVGAAESPGGRYPSATSDLFLPAPVSRWDEGLPLGNGLLGAVVYGENTVLHLALDRGDLWDLRQPTVEASDGYNWANLQRLKAPEHEREVQRSFAKPFETALYPAKIPAGYLNIGLRDNQAMHAFHLDLSRAEARLDIGAKQPLTAFVAATMFPGIVFLRIPGPLPDVQIVRPYSFTKRGYAAAESGIDGRVFWMAQKGPDGSGIDYSIVASSRSVGAETQIVATIVRASDAGAGDNLIAVGRERVATALNAGYDAALRPHLDWWRAFWAGGSRLGLPDDRLQSQCDRTRYFYGASSRAGAPPIAGQGVWTEDALTPAAQSAAYRHDLGLPATYLPYAPMGLPAVGDALCEYYVAKTTDFEAFARNFYDIEAVYTPRAAVIPTNMAEDGQAIGGWPPAALMPTSGAWVALLFLRHARFGYGGASFLENRAYPFAGAVGNGLTALLEPGAGGKARLPLSSSPELSEDRRQAYVAPDSNWDLALMTALFGALTVAATTLGKPEEAARWQAAAAKLEPLHRDSSGGLLIAEGEPYVKSAPHLGHAAAIYPFGLVTIEGSAEDRRTIAATLADFKRVGTEFWLGESFAWHAALLARCGQAERAMIGLDYFVRGFVSINGFHIGGDQTGNGFTRIRERGFSLKGNFLALEAVHEMLLQGWGDVVRIFPATTQNWPDVSFAGLRTENGLLVSATRKKGRTARIALEATRDGDFRLRNPFGSATPHWSRSGVRRIDSDYAFALKRGETLEGHV